MKYTEVDKQRKYSNLDLMLQVLLLKGVVKYLCQVSNLLRAVFCFSLDYIDLIL